MTRKICLLWDIDGTLIWSGGAGERSFERAIKTVHDTEVDITQINYSGRTDRMIAQMLADHLEIPTENQKVPEIVEAYLSFLPEEMASGTAVELAGVRALLDRAEAAPNISQGLLTGNMIAGAEIKLAHFDLWKYFDFGGFANASPERNLIAESAKKQAAERGLFEDPQDIWVIGDTPHDITCGKHIGARTMITATGRESLEQLTPYGPDAAFEDLSDVEAVWERLVA